MRWDVSHRCIVFLEYFIWIINKFTYYYVRWKVSCYCILRVLNNYSISHKLSICLDWAYFLCVSVFLSLSLSLFFFFFMHAFQPETKCTIHALFIHCSWDPQPLYSEKNIKNGSYSTIHTFKNYFATMFSVFSKISCIQMDSKCLKDSLRIGNSSSLSFFFSLIISFRGGSDCRM